MKNPRSRSAAPWRPPTWRSLVTPLLLVLASVVTVVILLSTVVNFFLVSREPQAAVDTYLGQLERGSSRQVLAPFGMAGVDSAMQILPNPAYRHAANRPVGHRLVSVQESGSRADVVMDVRTGDGKTHRVEYSVERRSNTGFLNDTWRLRQPDAAPVRVLLPAAVDTLAVNGQTVRVDDAAVRPGGGQHARIWQFAGLPGRYEVGLPKNSYLVASENTSVSINIDAPRTSITTLSFRPSPRMWEQVDRTIEDAVRTCETGAGSTESCPVPRGWSRSSAAASSSPEPRRNVPPGVSGVRWHLESRPALVLEPDGNDPLTFHARRYRPAVADVSYVRGGRTFTERVEFGVAATARSTGTTVETEVQLRPTLTHAERKYPRT